MDKQLAHSARRDFEDITSPMNNLTVCIINGIPERGSIYVPPLETGTAGLQDCVKGGRESDWMELDRMETEGEAGAASGVPLTSTSIMASDSPVGVRRGWTALSGLWGDASWGEGERGDADGTTGDRVAGCADPTTGWSGILS